MSQAERYSEAAYKTPGSQRDLVTEAAQAPPGSALIGSFTDIPADFDPKPEARKLQLLAFNAMHGDVNSNTELSKELTALKNSPFAVRDRVADELIRPDKSLMLPMAEMALNDKGEVSHITFAAGLLDGTAKQPMLTFDYTTGKAPAMNVLPK
jgi:hypothetical protein